MRLGRGTFVFFCFFSVCFCIFLCRMLFVLCFSVFSSLAFDCGIGVLYIAAFAVVYFCL